MVWRILCADGRVVIGQEGYAYEREDLVACTRTGMISLLAEGRVYPAV